MQKIIYVFLGLYFLFVGIGCKGRWIEANAPYLNTIECLGVGKDYGTIQLATWVYAKSPEEAVNTAKSQILKEIALGTKTIEEQGCPTKPIISDVTKVSTHTLQLAEECFEKVMQNNPPENFIISAYFGQDRFRETERKIKYKVYIILNHDKLRKTLEEAECAKKLADYK